MQTSRGNYYKQHNNNGWATAAYRLSYDIVASLVGALPRGFLRPFEYLATMPYEQRIIKNQFLITGLQSAVSPLLAITEFYLQKPIANLISMPIYMAVRIFDPIISLFKSAYQYPNVTRNNKYFLAIRPGPVGQFVQKYASFAVWGGILGLAATQLYPDMHLAYTIGQIAVEGYPAFALAGAALGLSTRFAYENVGYIARKCIQALSSTFNAAKELISWSLNKLSAALVWTIEQCQKLINMIKPAITQLYEGCVNILKQLVKIPQWIGAQLSRFGHWAAAKFEASIAFIRQGPRAMWAAFKDKTFGAVIRYLAAIREGYKLQGKYTTKIYELKAKHTIITDAKAAELITAMNKGAADAWSQEGVKSKIDYLSSEVAKIKVLKEATDAEIREAFSIPPASTGHEDEHSQGYTPLQQTLQAINDSDLSTTVPGMGNEAQDSPKARRG
jgi:hypothetical protein